MVLKTLPSLRAVLLIGVVIGACVPANAQIVLTPNTQGGSFSGTTVCANVGWLYLSGDSGDCDSDDAARPDTLTFSAGTTLETLAGSFSRFDGSTNFNGIVQMSGGQVLSGQTLLTGSVTVINPLNTNGIFNSGTVVSTGLQAANSLLVTGAGTVHLGGNQVHGVLAGTNSFDAVNLSQLLAATGGINNNVTALQTLTATHSGQIAALEAESLYVDINSDGPAASATGNDAIAIGESAVASAADALAIGRASTASGPAAIAIGQGATATGSVAVGAGASAALGGAAFGDIAVATGSISTAAGNAATATNTAATAIGSQAVASGVASSALGHNSDATALGATAVGVSAQATQNFATSLGRIANASAIGATAIGNAASATADNSVALGSNSVANQANTVSVGAAGTERRVVNVAAGIGATDAVNLGQLNAVSAEVDTLFELRSRDRRDMKQGVAAAMALANAPMPSAPGKVAYAANGATYRGEYAFGGALQYRLNTDAPMAFNFGVSHAGGKNTGVRVGVAGEF